MQLKIFDILKPTKALIQSAMGNDCDLDPLQNRLSRVLNNKRSLLV